MEFEDYEKLLNTVYRTAPIGLCLFDTRLRFRHINEWLAAINGHSVEAHLGRTISEMIPDVSEGVEVILRRVMETGEPVLNGVVEAVTPASPQQKKFFQHSYHVVMSNEGTVAGVSCVVQDITRRKLAEDALIDERNDLEDRVRARTEELSRSESRHRILLESTHAVPWEVDATTLQFTYVGPQAGRLLGCPAEQWLDTDFWSSRIHPEDREFAIDYCLRSMKSKEDFEFEYRMITVDGRTVWIHDIVNVDSEAGEPKALRGFMIDITERKLAEEKFVRVLEAAPDAMIVVDKAGTIGLVNEQTEKLFGFDRRELIGQSIEILVPALSRKQHVSYRETYNRNPQVRAMGPDLNLAACHKDGREIAVEISLSPCETIGDWSVIASIRDVTARRAIESSLRVMSGRILNAQEEERSRIARELHDDFNQRLALLAVDLDLLSQTFSGSKVEVKKELNRLSNCVREISTDVHRLSHHLHPSHLDHLGLVAAARSYCKQVDQSHDISIAFDHEGVPKSVSFDVSLCIYRIIQEALQNVIRHSHAANAEVRLTEEAGMLKLSIRDSGVGFDKSNDTQGRGIGITSMQERARMIGGELWIETAPGCGTTIRVNVPLSESTAALTSIQPRDVTR